MGKTYVTRAVTFMIVSFSLTGCYRYIPTTLEAVPPGQEVQVMMTRDGARELAEITDLVPGPAPVLRGEVSGVENGDMLLTVPIGMRQEGFHQNALLQTVRVPTAEILSVGLRELDVVATAATIGGSAAALGLLVYAILDSFGGSSSGEGEELELSIFSLPFFR